MTIQQVAIESAVQEMGYESVYDFAAKQARELLLKDLKISVDRIEAFEAKYGMDYEAFDKHFFALTQFDLFEREDDGMDWRLEKEALRIIEKRLARLLA